MQEEWFKAQQQYWRAWQSALVREQAGAGFGSADWAHDTDAWWKTLHAGKASYQDLGNLYRIFEHGKHYLAFADSLRKFVETATGKSKPRSVVDDALSSMLDEMRKAVSGGGGGGEDSASEFLTFLSWPIASWRGVLTGLRDPGWAAPPGGPDVLADLFKCMPGAPSLGLAREWGVRQKSIQASILHQSKAQAKLLNEHGRIGQLAVERFAAQFSRKRAGQGDVDTLKELYDLWVDCGEGAYREIVMTDRYAKAYGKFTNAAMKTRKQMQELRDAMLGAADIPNRPEINTIIKRQNELRQTLDQLVDKVNAMGSESLRQHVELLTDEVNELREEVNTLSSKARLRSNQAPATEVDKEKPKAGKEKPKAGKKNPSARAGRANARAAPDEFDIGGFTTGKD